MNDRILSMTKLVSSLETQTEKWIDELDEKCDKMNKLIN